MAFIAKSLINLQKIKKPALIIYPLIIIIAIPAALIINTLWNLRSFNRDINFVLRHQALSMAETVKPFLSQANLEPTNASEILKTLVDQNDDLISAAIIVKQADVYSIFAASDSSLNIDEVSLDPLNRFTNAMDTSFAGLRYDATLQKNVWIVTTPMKLEGSEYIISLKLDTTTVDTILARTSRDSLLILLIAVAFTLVLLINHFIFYKRSLRTQQLEEIDKLKDEFISMASHELRAPVTALLGYLELLKGKIPESSLPTIKPELNILNSLTNDLNGLINDLLEVSRIEQQRLKIEVSETDVNLVIRNVYQKFKPLADQKGLKLEIMGEQMPKTVTDPKRLGQILTNLISNAIKYTIQGGITITTNKENDKIKITVKDTGIGIPPEEMSKLFGKFMRIKDKKTKEVRGTGLGLWISKQLAEMLGGELFAESIYGTGSSFTFTIPIRTFQSTAS